MNWMLSTMVETPPLSVHSASNPSQPMKDRTDARAGGLLPFSVIGLLLTTGQLSAQTSGTWNLDGPGNWSDTLKWSGGNVASGATATADFSTIDITGDHVINVDGPYTIGSLLLQDLTTSSNSWIFNGTGPLTLDNGASQPSIDVINQTTAISVPLEGTNGFSKTGSGTLEISGAANYTGDTTVAAGTLQTTGADDRLPPGTTLAFTGTSGGLDLTTTSQTLADLTVPNGLAATYTVSGTSLTLDGAADRQFGPGGSNPTPVTPSHSITMDFAGLSSFTSTAPANIFRVGMKGGSNNSGTLGNVATVILADQNEITADSLRIGDVAANNHGGTSTLRLGIVNTINVDSINNGYSGRSNTNLLFDAGLTNPSVTIRNTDGSSAVSDWRVGNVQTFNTTTWTDTVDFSGGSVDALVNTLTIGSADIGGAGNRAGTENASFTMGDGVLDASSLIVGRIANTTGTIANTMAANGTFTLDHSNGVVKAGTLILAENTTLAGGSGSRSVSGTFNLTDGTVEATNIQLGDQSGNATATANFNWTNGTIRSLTAAGLVIDSVPLNLLPGNHVLDATEAGITVNSSSSVSGDGGLTKIGTNTVSLEGLNDYTGPTDVQAGTLTILNSFPSGSTLTVAPTATLSLADVTIASPLDIDGSLVLTGPVRLSAAVDSAFPGSFPGLLQYGSITGSENLQHPYRNATITTGATSTDLTVSAGIPLTWTGSVSDDWNFNNSANWKDGANNSEKFFWADSVIFDSAGSGFPNVNLTEELRPSAVTVNEDTIDYVFTGSGFISGSTGITKNGLAKLTISTSNTNTGITTINAGTLEIGDGGTNGALGSGNIVNNSALVFNRSDNATLENEISGTGSATKLGDGVLTVISDNSYAGGTTTSAGTIQVGTQSNPTGSLGTGEVVNDGSLRLNQADGSNPYAYTFANDISGTGGLLIGQVGAGAAFDSVVTLTGNNSFTGDINVNSGGLTILDVAALGTGHRRVLS